MQEIKDIQIQEQQMIDQYGFIIHAVMDGSQTANIHTHGLAKSFDHPDLQCVIPLPSETIHAIFHTLVNQIRGGKRFKAGELVPEILTHFNITFTWATESDRDVLRLILPDKKGELSPEKIQGVFKLQYKGQMLQ